ncbi:MAG TPA: FAD-dependent oxidoreductase [Euryarchaeota archaeon]|nr:FAD-dependent oxidoreductase [Euryarchaeota archaeon]
MAKRIIVIGSGAAGMSAASAAREASPDADITVFTEDEDIAYSPCAIPWGIEGRSQWDEIVMHTPQFYSEKRNIRVLTKTKVESVDGEAKTVTAGGESYPYDSLVIATGGRVFVPPIAGTDLKNVFVVRTVRDGRDIQAALSDVDRVVIGGAGVIGLELAVSLREMGKDVTVIEMMDQVIPRIADKDMADEIQAHLEEKGIRFVMKAPIQAVNGDGRVESVTAAGQEYPCGLMIFATGVRANLDIAKSLGLDVGQLGALVASPTLNAYRRGRLVPDVFVAGDVMQCESAVMPGATMSQLGSTAVRQGRVAGHNAAGSDKMLFGPVASPWVSVIGDKQIAGTGLSLGLASWYGIDTVTGKAEGLTRARYYPGGMELKVKVIADKTTHRIVGAQIIAGEEATGRIDWLTSAIINGMTAEDFLVRSENAYCPPTSMVKDVVISAVEDLCRHL